MSQVSIVYSTADKPSYFFQWEPDRFESEDEAQRFINENAPFFAEKRTIRTTRTAYVPAKPSPVTP